MMKEKYFCRQCKGLRNHQQIHESKKRGGDDEGHFQWINNYLIIECLGCETISFLEVYGNTEMVDYGENGEVHYYYNQTIYPYFLEEGEGLRNSNFIPPSIKTIYDETIAAFKTDSRILTAGGLRAVIEATCNHLKIKKESLANRIDMLNKHGYLTLNESNRLHSIRFLGNDALHEIEKPKKEQLYLLLDIVNHLLSNLFINDKKIKGKVETIIDKYDDFLKLIQNKVNKEMIGHELTLDKILGKSKRLISNKNYMEFVDKFRAETEQGMHEFVTVMLVKDGVKYKIAKEPEFTFDW